MHNNPTTFRFFTEMFSFHFRVILSLSHFFYFFLSLSFSLFETFFCSLFFEFQITFFSLLTFEHFCELSSGYSPSYSLSLSFLSRVDYEFALDLLFTTTLFTLHFTQNNTKRNRFQFEREGKKKKK